MYKIYAESLAGWLKMLRLVCAQNQADSSTALVPLRARTHTGIQRPKNINTKLGKTFVICSVSHINFGSH